MFILNRKPVGAGLRATVLAGAVVAALGVSGIGAAGAHAEAACNGADIVGGGSSLQRVANQNVWIPAFESTVCSGEEAPTVSYSSSDSGAGLAAWGASGSGTISHELQFIGTDQAPNASEIASIKGASTASDPAGEGTELLVVPVAQTAVALVANPPKGCSISQVKNSALERALEGRKKSWSDLPNATGSGCNRPITRVVPADVTGTTYQLKHYLSLVEPGELPCLAAGSNTWTVLQAKSLNTVWPEACRGHRELTQLKRSLQGGTGAAPGVGGVDEVKTVNATSGSIGFAALPDAEATKSGSTVLLALENGTNAKGKVTYASPGTASKEANCGAATYSVPAAAQLEGGSGLNADWSGSYGSSLVSASYPICTLTWDLTFLSYRHAGFIPDQGTTVRDYVYWYLLEGTGQGDVARSGTGYSRLPSSPNSENDVLDAALFAASQIGS